MSLSSPARANVHLPRSTQRRAGFRGVMLRVLALPPILIGAWFSVTLVAAVRSDVPGGARDLDCDGSVTLAEWYRGGLDQGWRPAGPGTGGCMEVFRFKDGLPDVVRHGSRCETDNARAELSRTASRALGVAHHPRSGSQKQRPVTGTAIGHDAAGPTSTGEALGTEGRSERRAAPRCRRSRTRCGWP